MKIYDFKADDAYRFANTVPGEKKVQNGQLVFQYCPYCHGGKSGDKNTFYISLRTGQFDCKRSSCSVHGNMITLARDFDFPLSEDVNRYYNVNDYNNKFRKFKAAHIKTTDKAVEYLNSRGISKEIAEKYQITIKSGTDNVLVFPFIDPEGEMKFIKYRKTDFDKSKDKNKEWCESNCMPILFGMNQCEDFKTLIMTEGQLDSLSLAEAGIRNAVSVPMGCNGFTWIPHCWDWLVKFEELIIFGDCEKGHITLVDEMSKRFPNKVKVVSEADYCGYKDANDILRNVGKTALVKAVNNASVIPERQIKRLSEVEAVDILNTPAIATQIPKLDKLLSGGFHEGQLILLTGKRGDGKSTFMSQLIANATDQGFASFVYSGELVDFYFKRWIDQQFSGRDVIPNNVITEMNKWYNDKIFLYDNNVIDDEEMDDLITVVEHSIQKYGCKLICLDNLMTAIDVGMNEDLYRAQSRFVGKLAKLAKLHNVVIILVAHPRKSREGFTNDDVSGSADITNKVDIVMSYCRENVEDPDERNLKVTKNRLTGRLTSDNNKIYLYYSQTSKRIIGENESFERDYGWKFCGADNDGFIQLPDEEENPFQED